MKKNIIIALAILVVGIVAGLLCRPKGCSSTTIVQRDTTIVRDTITIEKPIPVSKIVTDTMLVVVRDTIRIKDTLYISLPREKKVYNDEEYYAEVSGYMPSLDVIQVYPKTKFVTETQRETVRQRNFVSAGTEVSYIESLSAQFYVEYERMLHRNVGMNVRAIYDAQSGNKGVSVGIKAQLGW